LDLKDKQTLVTLVFFSFSTRLVIPAIQKSNEMPSEATQEDLANLKRARLLRKKLREVSLIIPRLCFLGCSFSAIELFSRFVSALILVSTADRKARRSARRRL
jgi:hypothetical protein